MNSVEKTYNSHFKKCPILNRKGVITAVNDPRLVEATRKKIIESVTEKETNKKHPMFELFVFYVSVEPNIY